MRQYAMAMTTAVRFDVLIHAPFYGALRALAPDVRARFRRLVDRLRAGHWSGGTRVKKLRGCAKPVFEARQDAGDRVLFTLAHTAARDASTTLRAHLMLWDLVHHDRVSGRANRLNPSAEAEFLDFEELEAEIADEPPPHPAATFREVSASAQGAEAGVFDLMLADGDAPRAREEITGGVRWYVLPERLFLDEAQWQELMDRGSEELELKLTAEQYAVVRAPGPVLLSGSAGSGKTTIAVHRLAAALGTAEGVRALYLTYSPWLRDHAGRLFDDLLACRGDVFAASPGFLTVHELYRTLIAETGGAAPGAVVDYPEFARWYEGQFRRPDAALAWEEIRGIVKGASLDPARPLLPREEYEALGRKRAPAFVGERGRLHQVARRWQEHLEIGRRLDEIDLCRLALASVPPGGLYDHLVCDEAQDLAEIQMELLLRLVPGRSLGGLFLAGDPQQVINPSGFRWAEVRSRIRDRFIERGRPAPELVTLTRNFRSVRGLVELANEVIAFKRERTGRSEGDETEQSEVAGAAPILVAGDEDALADAIRGFGPRCAVVAGSADVRERLQTALGTTRVFTVPEAKGLEFDVAILWGVVAADPAPWRRLLDPGQSLREDPPARRALHHLYVAVTRARRHLAVYEPAGAPPLWTSDRFAAHLDPEPPASLSRLFVRSAAPGEWLREGEYFHSRGRHRQAAECFRRAGDARREAGEPRPASRGHGRAGARRPALARHRRDGGGRALLRGGALCGRRPAPTGRDSETRSARAAAARGPPRRRGDGRTRRPSGRRSRRGRTPRAAGPPPASGGGRSTAWRSRPTRPAGSPMPPAAGKTSRSGTAPSPRGGAPVASARRGRPKPAPTNRRAAGSRRRPHGTRPVTRPARSAAAPMRRSRRGAGRRRPAAGKSSASTNRPSARGSAPGARTRASAARRAATWPRAASTAPPRRSRRSATCPPPRTPGREPRTPASRR